MAKVIVFANKKGGVGKSTATMSVAGAMGYTNVGRVLVIDMDAQANLTKDSGGEPDVQGTYEFLKGASLDDVVQHHQFYDFIGADSRLSNTKEFADRGQEFLLKYGLSKIQDSYDFILIDTPPAMETMTFSSLIAANYVIACCDADARSLDGLADLAKNINITKLYYNPEIKLAGILVTKCAPRTNASKEASILFDKAATSLETVLFKTHIHDRSIFHECSLLRKNIFSYAPTSAGAKQYIDLVRELKKIVK